MKRIFAVIAIISFAASTASADYALPPGWENDQYFTHQSWDFLSDDNPSAPDGPVAVFNPGSPTAMIPPGSGLWTNGLGSLDGGWRFDGPINLSQSQPQIVLIIPNIADADLMKQVWLQLTFETSYDLNYEAGLELYALANGSQEYTPKTSQIEVIDEAARRARVTAWIDIIPQPPCETINIAVDVPDGQWFFIDEIDVDTRCIEVPEPTALVLLFTAAILCWAAFRVRKKDMKIIYTHQENTRL